MSIFIACLFGGIAVAIFFKNRFLRKELTSLSIQMHEIDCKKTNQQLRVHSQTKELVSLTAEINALYTSVSMEHGENVRKIHEVQKGMENISHDLRTPLTSIVGYLNILSSGNLSSEKEEEYLEICQRKANSLQKLVENLFTLSRLENEEYPFEMERLNLSSLLEEELASMYDLFVNAAIEPSISIPESPIYIIGDRQAFARIFSNLLGNAVKHGTGRTLNIRVETNENHMILQFENPAKYIKIEDVGKLFVRSFTADHMRSKENTGYGLAIAKEFVEQMGGEIWAEKKGKSLCFFIKLTTTS